MDATAKIAMNIAQHHQKIELSNRLADLWQLVADAPTNFDNWYEFYRFIYVCARLTMNSDHDVRYKYISCMWFRITFLRKHQSCIRFMYAYSFSV